MTDIVDRITSKFTCGNGITVNRALITADEWSALLAHIQRGAVPEGWQVVPKEPTPEMQFPSYMGSDGPNWPERQAIYKAMLAAAPAPDHFRDAAKMVPAPAEVPMPEPDGRIFTRTMEGFGIGVDAIFMGTAHKYGDAREAAGYARGLRDAGRDAVPVVQNGEVLVTVAGLTGSGKSAIAGEIEIMCRALGLDAEWVGGAAEKHLTHSDWTESLEMYRPRVRIVEANIPRTDAALRGEVKP